MQNVSQPQPVQPLRAVAMVMTGPIPRVINMLNGVAPIMPARRRPIMTVRRASLLGFTQCSCGGDAKKFVAKCNICGQGWYQTMGCGFARTGSELGLNTYVVSNQVSNYGGWCSWTVPDATVFGEVPFMPRGPEPPSKVFNAPGSDWIKNDSGIWELKSLLLPAGPDG